VHGFFSVPVDHLTALGVLAEHFREHRPRRLASSSPPTSATPRRPRSSPGCSGCRSPPGSKQRKSDDKVVIDSIVGDVAGKRAIILDDEIATGGSIVELLDKLEELGCPSASVACTHGLFAGGGRAAA
jgi:ribose-phosphate pyrophosphokinase